MKEGEGITRTQAAKEGEDIKQELAQVEAVLEEALENLAAETTMLDRANARLGRAEQVFRICRSRVTAHGDNTYTYAPTHVFSIFASTHSR